LDPISIPKNPLRFVDTHTHLDDEAFNVDRPDVIQRARTAGVDRIVLIGYREAIWRRTIETARSFDRGTFALGIHPQNADEADDGTIDRLREVAVDSGAVAIGETGIDLFREGPELARQREIFRLQLELALELGLPTIIHQRAAEAETLSILRDRPLHQRIILHSFDAGPETARVARERGWFIGVGGLMTRRSNETVREIVRTFPLEQVVLETDAPYLVPSGVKARRNEPANVAIIAERLAALRAVDVEEIAAVTASNAEVVFQLRG